MMIHFLRTIALTASLLLTLTSYGQHRLSRPEKDFETYWKAFRDYYPFFDLKGVNWDSLYMVYRPQVSRKTSQETLISILSQMADPLQDGHVTIAKGEKILYKSRKPSPFREEFKGLEADFWRTSDSTLIQLGFPKPAGSGPLYKNEHLFYFSRTDQTAYLRITRCFGTVESLFDDKLEQSDTRLMLHLLDSLIQKAADVSTIVIDLRCNGGGHAGLEMASRFADTTILTHHKAVRNGAAYSAFSTPEPQYIHPFEGPRYTGKVLLLTNDRTASSAEDFTLSLYQRPYVTTVGAHTSGMLSDMRDFNLSKGYVFTLSFQIYYSAQMQPLEDTGIPVTVPVTHTRKELEMHLDPVILKAIALSK